ncbi:MAG: formylglycine-generating enzyme family protein [Bacteroidia bacterium]|nr:formylglycine-generating enzyme family protein [Bacteroidia bacterium]
MNKKITLLSTAFWFHLSLVAQWANCLPDNPLTIKSPAFSEASVTEKIRSSQVFYNDNDILSVKNYLDKCNSKTEDELRTIQGNIAATGLKYQEILSLKDVAGIQRQIEDLKQSKISSIQTLEENLTKTRHSGLFLVVLPEINLMDNKNVFIRNAQSALAPYAISDLNGERIERLTEVKDYENVKDVITSFKGGDVTPVSDLMTNADYKNKCFIYVVKVNVSPAKKDALKTTSAPSGTGNEVVVNLMTDPNFALILQKYNVPESVISEINQKISTNSLVIQNENADADQRQAEILLQGEDEIRKIDHDIAEYTQRMQTRKVKLKSTIETIPGASYNPADAEASVLSALNTLKDRMTELNKQWNGIKEQELQYKETQVMIEGDPAEALAKETMRLYDQLQQNFTTIKRSMEFISVENFEVTDYKSADEMILYRQVNQIWSYLVPQSNGSFRLMLLAKFQIQDGKTPPVKQVVAEKPGLKANPVPKPAPAEGRNKNFDRDPRLIYYQDSLMAVRKRDSLMKGLYFNNQDLPFKNYKESALKGLEMIAIEKGAFYMGSEEGNKDELPVHSVWTDNFYLSKYEVTVGQWKIYCKETGRESVLFPGGSSDWNNDLPVSGVTWYEATDFCKWLSEKTGLNYRLPAEAEWEYAARGGNLAENKRYSGGSDANQLAWYNENSMLMAHPVGMKKPNALGLYDMSGNVYEWCLDIYGPYEDASAESGENKRIIRGGSFAKSSSFVRIANRSSFDPARRNAEIGFRIARNGE